MIGVWLKKAVSATCLFFCVAALAAAQSSPSAAAKPRPRALLTRGSEAVKGLPNFGRNALSAIYGEYRLVDAPDGLPPRVWMTSEPLYISAADWSAFRFAGRAAFAAKDAKDVGEYRLFLFDRPFSSEGQGAAPRLWSVIIALPSAGQEAQAAYERFAPVFLDKLSYFLSNARSPTDASFPAVLEW